MNQCIVVTGLTATGKTGIAYEIAKRENGILINADAMQVYRYMDIGTNKERFPDVETKLLDIINPDEAFNIHLYQQLAKKAIDEVLHEGKLPVIVGGSPLYIYALVKDYALIEIGIDAKLREKLEGESVSVLQDMLHSLDAMKFTAMNYSDKNNPRRLIRAIEIAKYKKKMQRKEKKTADRYTFRMIAPQFQWETLRSAIHTRVEKMMASGLVEENRKLVDRGYGYDLASMQGIGYREFRNYFTKEISLEEIRHDIEIHTWDFAKKQYTWFKRDTSIEWIDR